MAEMTSEGLGRRPEQPIRDRHASGGRARRRDVSDLLDVIDGLRKQAAEHEAWREGILADYQWCR